MAMLKDFGWIVKGEVCGDVSVAQSIIHRHGLGRTRHIDTGLPWTQQTAAETTLEHFNVLGTENPADLKTTRIPREGLDRHNAKLEVSFPMGRATSAPIPSGMYGTKAYLQMGYTNGDEIGEGEITTETGKTINNVWSEQWDLPAENIIE